MSNICCCFLQTGALAKVKAYIRYSKFNETKSMSYQGHKRSVHVSMNYVWLTMNLSKNKNRIGLCGAWSFDNTKGRCYLHTIDGCCGQYGKREVNSDWISGYVCRQCWSTLRDTDCPCSIRERAWRPKTKDGADETPPSDLAVKFKDQHQRRITKF